MKKHIASIIVLFAISFVTFFSCKKSSSSPTPASNLVGSWKITKGYLDINGNGAPDASEAFTDTSLTNQVMKANSDGTYTITYYSTVTTGTWTLLDNNTYIKTTDASSTALTKYYGIVTLTATNMELKDTTGVGSGSPALWFFYTKQ